MGNLMTTAIPEKVLTDLRMALEALPEDSQALQGSLNIILIQDAHIYPQDLKMILNRTH